MLSSHDIRNFQQQAARKAARDKKQPITVFSAESAERDLRSCPNLGSYLAKGWQRVVDLRGEQAGTYFASVCEQIVEALTERARSGSRSWAGHIGGHAYQGPDAEDFRFFVDKAGWGDPGEPALSLDETVENLQYAINALAKLPEKHTLGVGIVEEGQFQCYVGLFLKTAKPAVTRAAWRARQKGVA